MFKIQYCKVSLNLFLHYSTKSRIFSWWLLHLKRIDLCIDCHVYFSKLFISSIYLTLISIFEFVAWCKKCSYSKALFNLTKIAHACSSSKGSMFLRCIWSNLLHCFVCLSWCRQLQLHAVNHFYEILSSRNKCIEILEWALDAMITYCECVCAKAGEMGMEGCVTFKMERCAL